MSARPLPPEDLLENPFPEFRPSRELEEWARATFIVEGAELENPEHAHLNAATIGFVWTTVENARRGRRILGSCQIMPPQGDVWGAGRAAQQITQWFGGMVDFLIVLDANACAEMDDVSFCALVEHELTHAGQAKDQYGSPMFSKQTGRPIFCTRGHCVEEFVSVVERYGSTSPELSRMVDAINTGPKVSRRKVEIACGTCVRLRAV